MNVSPEDKMELLTALMPIMLRALAAKVPEDQEVSADDIVDLLSLGIAAVIDNDSLLTTPSHRRKAIETVGKRMADQILAYRHYRDTYGQSYLSSLIDGPLVPDGPTN